MTAMMENGTVREDSRMSCNFASEVVVGVGVAGEANMGQCPERAIQTPGAAARSALPATRMQWLFDNMSLAKLYVFCQRVHSLGVGHQAFCQVYVRHLRPMARLINSKT